MLAILILLPVAAGCFLWLARRHYVISQLGGLLFALLNLAAALRLYQGGQFSVILPVTVPGFSLTLRADQVAELFLLFAAAMVPLLLIYSIGFVRDKKWGGLYLLYLCLSIAMVNGALLSDDLGLLLFFWEGLLGTLFGMLLLRNRENPRAAVKALTVSGLADLILMLGIAASVYSAHTTLMSGMQQLPVTGVGALGCAALLMGALGKAGCMPFHAWIPLAAEDAPTPFLAAFPGSLEKILGIYLAARVVTELYAVKPGSAVSVTVMIFGAATILLAGAMALAQTDLKRLLAYSAVSQVGYMVLGLGSGLAVGVAGAVFHLFNHVLYKTGLFMTAGAVEAAAGTTDLRQLGGLRHRLPLTTGSVVIFSLAITGFPGLNGFYSKELVFDAALEVNVIFYLAALLGAVITAIYILKMLHSVFWGQPAAAEINADQRQGAQNQPAAAAVNPAADQLPTARQAKVTGRQGEAWALAIPQLLLALACVGFAVGESPVVDGLIGQAFNLQERFGGFPKSAALVIISCLALALAGADHLYGWRRETAASRATDHLTGLPGLRQLYVAAQRGCFDLYVWLTAGVRAFSRLCQWIENGVTWFYDIGVPRTIMGAGNWLSALDNGSLARYLALAIVGMLAVGLIFILML
ncbi:MAG: proton-conducting transporter membrane subunit [Oscillospiraceae bacterium]|nr:proton-conducting transporter membrane subunit [Oscillospiraceae bacterium]MDD4368177.1 proton-conducting transporter membrane subunit [Oscillospiraceae bacterium]